MHAFHPTNSAFLTIQYRAFKKLVQGSHLLNDAAAGIHFILTGEAEGGELGNKAGMCSGC